MEKVLYFLIAIIWGTVAVVAMILSVKKFINPEVAWIIWGACMFLWMVFIIAGFSKQ